MGFEWDPAKAPENVRKHGVSFSTEAQAVFSDDFAIAIADGSNPFEQRFLTVGATANLRLLVSFLLLSR